MVVLGGLFRRCFYDVPTGCMMGLGDVGVLFSIGPIMGASPCMRSVLKVWNVHYNYHRPRTGVANVMASFR